MKSHVRLSLPMALLALGLIAGALARPFVPDNYELPPPAAGTVPEFAVPFAVARAVALNRAAAVWPRVAPGPVVPYQDLDGATSAYAFHFRVDGAPFPTSYTQVVREAREDIARFADEGGAPPTGKYRYAHVLVSARYDRAPVLTWGEGLSEYYMTLSTAQQAAAAELGTPDPALTRIYFTWPLTWYEFSAGARTLVVHSQLPTRREPGADFLARERAADAEARRQAAARFAAQGKTWEEHVAALRRQASDEWRRAETRQVTNGNQFFVYAPEKAPFYDWSLGCTPTACAMIFGWYDRVHEYARLVEWYYQRFDAVQAEMDYNVPDCLLKLAVAMGTDTMTGNTPSYNIGPGLLYVANDVRDYDFAAPHYESYEGANDYCWTDATSIIDAGRPFIFSYNRPGHDNHSVAVFGYDSFYKDYWVHTTWSPPGAWWHYSNSGNQIWTLIDGVWSQTPAPGAQVELVSPVGDTTYNGDGQGEVWHAWGMGDINWYANAQDSAKVYVSFDGGGPGTWESVGKTTLSRWFHVDLTPLYKTDSARVMVVTYYHDYSGQAYRVGGDGSHGNFRIVDQAPPVPKIIYPPNNAVLSAAQLPVKPKLFVHRISYAWEYDFYLTNDSVGTFTSGWIDDTAYHSPVVLPVGSTGYWKCRAKNPTGTSDWTGNAKYKVVLGYTYPKSKPAGKLKLVRHGGALARKQGRKSGTLAQEDEYVYLLNGNNTLDFLRYSTWFDTWTPACSVPAGTRKKKVKTGACLVADEDYAYAFKGGRTNEFYRYDPTRNAWDSLARPTFVKGLKGGFAVLTEVDGASYIYTGSGSSNSEWLVYDVARGIWQAATPETLPVEKAKKGSSFTCDTLGRLWFLHAGAKENAFYVLDLRDPGVGWVRKATLPLIAQTRKKKAKEGGCIEYFQGKIYAVKGGNTREFWRYTIERDAWEYVCEVGDGSTVPLTKGIRCGRSLTATEHGIYILVGNNTDDFFFFGGESGESFDSPQPATRTTGQDRTVVLDLRIAPTVVQTGATTIRYSIPIAGRASLKLLDATGRVVATLVNGFAPAGDYSVPLRSRGSAFRPAPGIYFVRLDAGASCRTQKLVIE